ncbi:mucin-4-like isoform X2 [Liolophura sinensis]
MDARKASGSYLPLKNTARKSVPGTFNRCYLDSLPQTPLLPDIMEISQKDGELPHTLPEQLQKNYERDIQMDTREARIGNSQDGLSGNEKCSAEKTVKGKNLAVKTSKSVVHVKSSIVSNIVSGAHVGKNSGLQSTVSAVKDCLRADKENHQTENQQSKTAFTHNNTFSLPVRLKTSERGNVLKNTATKSQCDKVSLQGNCSGVRIDRNSVVQLEKLKTGLNNSSDYSNESGTQVNSGLSRTMNEMNKKNPGKNLMDKTPSHGLHRNVLHSKQKQCDEKPKESGFHEFVKKDFHESDLSGDTIRKKKSKGSKEMSKTETALSNGDSGMRTEHSEKKDEKAKRKKRTSEPDQCRDSCELLPDAKRKKQHSEREEKDISSDNSVGIVQQKSVSNGKKSDKNIQSAVLQASEKRMESGEIPHCDDLISKSASIVIEKDHQSLTESHKHEANSSMEGTCKHKELESSGQHKKGSSCTSSSEQDVQEKTNRSKKHSGNGKHKSSDKKNSEKGEMNEQQATFRRQDLGGTTKTIKRKLEVNELKSEQKHTSDGSGAKWKKMTGSPSYKSDKPEIGSVIKKRPEIPSQKHDTEKGNMKCSKERHKSVTESVSSEEEVPRTNGISSSKAKKESSESTIRSKMSTEVKRQKHLSESNIRQVDSLEISKEMSTENMSKTEPNSSINTKPGKQKQESKCGETTSTTKRKMYSSAPHTKKLDSAGKSNAEDTSKEKRINHSIESGDTQGTKKINHRRKCSDETGTKRVDKQRVSTDETRDRWIGNGTESQDMPGAKTKDHRNESQGKPGTMKIDLRSECQDMPGTKRIDQRNKSQDMSRTKRTDHRCESRSTSGTKRIDHRIESQDMPGTKRIDHRSESQYTPGTKRIAHRSESQYTPGTKRIDHRSESQYTPGTKRIDHRSESQYTLGTKRIDHRSESQYTPGTKRIDHGSESQYTPGTKRIDHRSESQYTPGTKRIDHGSESQYTPGTKRIDHGSESQYIPGTKRIDHGSESQYTPGTKKIDHRSESQYTPGTKRIDHNDDSQIMPGTKRINDKGESLDTPETKRIDHRNESQDVPGIKKIDHRSESQDKPGTKKIDDRSESQDAHMTKRIDHRSESHDTPGTKRMEHKSESQDTPATNRTDHRCESRDTPGTKRLDHRSESQDKPGTNRIDFGSESQGTYVTKMINGGSDSQDTPGTKTIHHRSESQDTPGTKRLDHRSESQDTPGTKRIEHRSESQNKTRNKGTHHRGESTATKGERIDLKNESQAKPRNKRIDGRSKPHKSADKRVNHKSESQTCREGSGLLDSSKTAKQKGRSQKGIQVEGSTDPPAKGMTSSKGTCKSQNSWKRMSETNTTELPSSDCRMDIVKEKGNPKSSNRRPGLFQNHINFTKNLYERKSQLTTDALTEITGKSEGSSLSVTESFGTEDDGLNNDQESVFMDTTLTNNCQSKTQSSDVTVLDQTVGRNNSNLSHDKCDRANQAQNVLSSNNTEINQSLKTMDNEQWVRKKKSSSEMNSLNKSSSEVKNGQPVQGGKQRKDICEEQDQVSVVMDLHGKDEQLAENGSTVPSDKLRIYEKTLPSGATWEDLVPQMTQKGPDQKDKGHPAEICSGVHHDKVSNLKNPSGQPVSTWSRSISLDSEVHTKPRERRRMGSADASKLSHTTLRDKMKKKYSAFCGIRNQKVKQARHVTRHIPPHDKLEDSLDESSPGSPGDRLFIATDEECDNSVPDTQLAFGNNELDPVQKSHVSKGGEQQSSDKLAEISANGNSDKEDGRQSILVSCSNEKSGPSSRSSSSIQNIEKAHQSSKMSLLVEPCDGQAEIQQPKVRKPEPLNLFERLLSEGFPDEYAMQQEGLKSQSSKTRVVTNPNTSKVQAQGDFGRNTQHKRKKVLNSSQAKELFPAHQASVSSDVNTSSYRSESSVSATPSVSDDKLLVANKGGSPGEASPQQPGGCPECLPPSDKGGNVMECSKTHRLSSDSNRSIQLHEDIIPSEGIVNSFTVNNSTDEVVSDTSNNASSFPMEDLTNSGGNDDHETRGGHSSGDVCGSYNSSQTQNYASFAVGKRMTNSSQETHLSTLREFIEENAMGRVSKREEDNSNELHVTKFVKIEPGICSESTTSHELHTETGRSVRQGSEHPDQDRTGETSASISSIGAHFNLPVEPVIRSAERIVTGITGKQSHHQISPFSKTRCWHIPQAEEPPSDFRSTAEGSSSNRKTSEQVVRFHVELESDQQRSADTDCSEQRGSTNMSPERGSTNMSPERGSTNMSPERGSTNMSPERGSTSISPERGSTSISAERGSTSISPERFSTSISAERGSTNMSPERGSTSISLERGSTSISAERGSTNMSPERGSTSISPERGSTDISLERGSINISAERGSTNISAERGNTNISAERGSNLLGETNHRSGLTHPREPNGQHAHEEAVEVNPRDRWKRTCIPVTHCKITTKGTLLTSSGVVWPQLFFVPGNRCICCITCCQWMNPLDFLLHYDMLPPGVEIQPLLSLSKHEIQPYGKLSKEQKLLWDQFCCDLKNAKERWAVNKEPEPPAAWHIAQAQAKQTLPCVATSGHVQVEVPGQQSPQECRDDPSTRPHDSLFEGSVALWPTDDQFSSERLQNMSSVGMSGITPQATPQTSVSKGPVALQKLVSSNRPGIPLQRQASGTLSRGVSAIQERAPAVSAQGSAENRSCRLTSAVGTDPAPLYQQPVPDQFQGCHPIAQRHNEIQMRDLCPVRLKQMSLSQHSNAVWPNPTPSGLNYAASFQTLPLTGQNPDPSSEHLPLSFQNHGASLQNLPMSGQNPDIPSQNHALSRRNHVASLQNHMTQYNHTRLNMNYTASFPHQYHITPLRNQTSVVLENASQNHPSAHSPAADDQTPVMLHSVTNFDALGHNHSSSVRNNISSSAHQNSSVQACNSGSKNCTLSVVRENRISAEQSTVANRVLSKQNSTSSLSPTSATQTNRTSLMQNSLSAQQNYLVESPTSPIQKPTSSLQKPTSSMQNEMGAAKHVFDQKRSPAQGTGSVLCAQTVATRNTSPAQDTGPVLCAHTVAARNRCPAQDTDPILCAQTVAARKKNLSADHVMLSSPDNLSRIHRRLSGQNCGSVPQNKASAMQSCSSSAENVTMNNYSTGNPTVIEHNQGSKNYKPRSSCVITNPQLLANESRTSDSPRVHGRDTAHNNAQSLLYESPETQNSADTLRILMWSQRCHNRILRSLCTERNTQKEEIKKLKLQLLDEIREKD